VRGCCIGVVQESNPIKIICFSRALKVHVTLLN
jgi:hypothetical protein